MDEFLQLPVVLGQNKISTSAWIRIPDYTDYVIVAFLPISRHINGNLYSYYQILSLGNVCVWEVSTKFSNECAALFFNFHTEKGTSFCL